jgi:Ca2+-transporting ATPase
MKRALPEERADLLRMPSTEGLDDADIEAMRVRYGTNLIAEQPPRSIAKLARDTARDPMIWFLVVTSGLFGLIGQYTDMAILLLAILPLIGMDLYLHRRTQASIEGLKSVLAYSANVLRSGSIQHVLADAIVPGDLVRVGPGESIPADGVIIAGDGLQTEESSLTGEAYPVAKLPRTTAAPPQDAAWAFAGTRLLTGHADIRVIFTGGDTIFGEIVSSAIGGPPGRTPLQLEVGRLVKVLLIIASVFCVLLAGVRLWQGFGPIDAFLSAATLAVAAIPEEFPVVLTFFLGVGVYRLARSKALVRRGVAVENIGRVSVICSDKTGTITEGRLAFAEACPAGELDTDELLGLAGLASRADSGDPLDVAILGKSPPVAEGWSKVSLFPFTEGRRRESACWKKANGTFLVATKGAPETILALCDISGGDREKWLETTRELSVRGQKVIACAWQGADEAPADEPTAQYRLAGLIGISDPVRPGVKEAITAALGAGIQVVMVTGDHPDTAMAIARQAGFAGAPLTISGDDLEAQLKQLDKEELGRLGVVARASPAQKVLLVEAFKQQGKIVAVTGDGVNDVPALRAADIGIAMGLRGTRSAREVSAIVLMDDNFRTIVSAIAEGRQLFRNLRMSFAFLLMVHIPLVTTAALMPFLGYPLLYLPLHIVWLELLIHPAAILGFQQASYGMSLGKADTEGGKFFTGKDWLVILTTGSAIAAGVSVLFITGLSSGETPDHARSMALVGLISSLVFLLLAISRSLSAVVLVIAGTALASTLLFVKIGAFSNVIHLHSLSWTEWLLAACIGGLPALWALRFRAASAQPMT